MSNELTPLQQHVRDDILGLGPDDPRPTVDPGLRDRLLDQLRQRASPLLDAIPADDPLIIAAYSLNRVHRCEAQWLNWPRRPTRYN